LSIVQIHGAINVYLPNSLQILTEILKVKMIRYKAWIAILAGLIIISAGCGSSTTDESQGRNMVTPAVEAIEARFGSLPLEDRISGTVIADNQVDIYAEISGIVEQVLVQNGDRVTRGQALLRIRDSELRERIKQSEAGLEIAKARQEQAEASLAQLQAQFDRAKSLADRNLSSQAEIDNITAQLTNAKANMSLAVAQVNQAQSSLDEAQVNISRTVIRSPVAGLVGQRAAEPGQLVTGNSRLFIVGDPQNVRVTIVLTERMMSYIREGMNVEIGNQAYPDTVVRATISRISPFLDPVTHTTTAEIDINNQTRFLIPGMFVAVDVFYGQSQNATLVPNSAVYRHPLTGIEGVYVARSIGTELQPVNKVDATSPPPLTEPTPIEFVEVNVLAKGRQMSGISGISSGTWVVTIGQNILAGGALEARVRTVGWDRILDLQNLTEEDVLNSIMNGNTPAPAASPSTSRL